MLQLVSACLVAVGMAILGWAIVLNRRLIASLPHGQSRSHWRTMTGLMVGFVIGYAAYLILFVPVQNDITGVIVPAIFLFGAGYVWLTAKLALETAEEVRSIAVLRQETVTDPLSGLFNRRYLDRRLEEEIARAKRYQTALSVMIVDFDHFKNVNDSHGHQAGDAVLRIFAELVHAALRENDFVARYGGEEFVIVAPHTGLAEASALAERIRNLIEGHVFALPAEFDLRRPLNMTASIGVASLGASVDSAQEIVRVADSCLYRAKRLGRNRVVTADLNRKSSTHEAAKAASAA